MTYASVYRDEIDKGTAPRFAARRALSKSSEDVLGTQLSRAYYWRRSEGNDARLALWLARHDVWSAPDEIDGFTVEVESELDSDGFDRDDTPWTYDEAFAQASRSMGMDRAGADYWARLKLIWDDQYRRGETYEPVTVSVRLSIDDDEYGCASLGWVDDDYRGAYVAEVTQELLSEALDKAQAKRAAMVDRETMATAARVAREIMARA